MTYTDLMKWELDHVFNDHICTFLATLIPDNFSKAYVLGPPKQLMNRKFLDEATSRFNYEEVEKSWMDNPTLFIP